MKKILFSAACLMMLGTTISYGQTPALSPANIYPSSNYNSLDIDNDNKISNGVLMNADGYIDNSGLVIGLHYALNPINPAYATQSLTVIANGTFPYDPIGVEQTALTNNGQFLVVIYKGRNPLTGNIRYFRATFVTNFPNPGTFTPASFNLINHVQINGTNIIGMEADNFGNVFYAYMNNADLMIVHTDFAGGPWTTYPPAISFANTVEGEGELTFSSITGGPNENVVHVAMANPSGIRVVSFEHAGGALNPIGGSPLLAYDQNTHYNFWDMIDISSPKVWDATLGSGVADQYVLAYPYLGRIRTYSPLVGGSTIVSIPTQSSFYGSVELEYQEACQKGYTLGVFHHNMSSHPELSLELDTKGIAVPANYKTLFLTGNQGGRNFSLAGKHSDYLSLEYLHGTTQYKLSKCISSNWRVAQPQETGSEEPAILAPNPVQNVLNISGDHIDFDGTVTISNMLGQTIYTKPINTEIDLSDLNPGQYIIALPNKDGSVQTEKITKL